LQTISFLFAVAMSLTSIYTNMSGAQTNPMTGVAVYPQKWWEPVFYLSLVSFVAILTMTRVARNEKFWICAGAFNIVIIILVYAMLITCAIKIP
jgi:hypothetical protein